MHFLRSAYGPNSVMFESAADLTFKVTTTLMMQPDRDGVITSAEVTARSQASGFEAQTLES